MRPLLPLLTTCAALATIPAPSAAKGIEGAEICGRDGCHAVDERFFHAVMTDGVPFTAPVAAAPFVTVQVNYISHGGAPPPTDRFTYLPSLGLVRPQGATQWTRLYPVRRAELDRIAAPVRPLPAGQLTGVVQPAAADEATLWWPLAGAAVAGLALLVLLGRIYGSRRRGRVTGSRPRTTRC